MEYIMINDGKLKVMLQKSDLDARDICIEELDYANPYAKLIFEEILDYAKTEFGFDTSGHKVLLQLYPSRDGGCELFISRLGEGRTEDSPQSKTLPRNAAFSFDSLSHMLAACRLLLSRGYSGSSSAFYDIYGRWYILLNFESSSNMCVGLEQISEYGESEGYSSLSLYLGEYARLLCSENAVSLLGKI